jgi:hypothetical protein
MIVSGKTYKLKESNVLRSKYGDTLDAGIRIEDESHNIWPGGWAEQIGNFACLSYAQRSAVEGLPRDKVYYGKIGNLGELVHESELIEII